MYTASEKGSRAPARYRARAARRAPRVGVARGLEQAAGRALSRGVAAWPRGGRGLPRALHLTLRRRDGSSHPSP